MAEPLLEVESLSKHFSQTTNLVESILRRDKAPIKAVDDVSLSLNENEVVGVIGESGCGKTSLLWTLIGLHDRTGGSMRLEGHEIGEDLPWAEYRRRVQLIFQDPFNSLNPRMTVRQLVAEPLVIHGMDNQEERVYQTLEDVELNPPDKFLDQRPAELSGGEKQRVSIARALAVDPDIILADEPVSMLDVSTQAAILNLLSRLIEERDVAMVYISHDLSTVSYVCDEINVMYLGRFVESAPTSELIEDPQHPYSQELINAIPVPDPDHDRERSSLDGAVPSPEEVGQGCRFKGRCPERMDVCDHRPREVTSDNRQVACHLYYDHESEVASEDSTVTAPGGDLR